MMPPIATLEQFAARMEAPPTPDKFTRIMALLNGASSAVRSRCGQQITPGETILARLTITNGIVRLPQRPVVEIAAVMAPHDDTDLMWHWHSLDAIHVRPNVPDDWSYEPFRSTLTSCRVSYTHGYNDPTDYDDLVGVVCNMAGRAFGINIAQTGYSQEMTGPYQASVGPAAAQGSLAMLEGERAIVDRYGYRPAVINTRPARTPGGPW